MADFDYKGVVRMSGPEMLSLTQYIKDNKIQMAINCELTSLDEDIDEWFVELMADYNTDVYAILTAFKDTLSENTMKTFSGWLDKELINEIEILIKENRFPVHLQYSFDFMRGDSFYTTMEYADDFDLENDLVNVAINKRN